ncbi:MAG: transposase domain-containing protein, partial [Pseudomonadales bacterium]|nr:transposase domain-containing protein [Pseudomonadales bacterium]
SLVETAKAYKLNVFDYLTHVLEVLPGVTSEAELDALLPWNVKLPD